MANYSVEFSSYETGTYYGGYYYVRIKLSDVYNSANNTSTITITSVEFKPPVGFGSVPVFGKVLLNNTLCADYEGKTNVSTAANTYRVCSYSNFKSIIVPHDINGEAVLNIRLEKADNITGQRFGITYENSVWGVSTPQTINQNLVSQTSTLTINPNGGSWEGDSFSQSFVQAPSTTKLISLPTKTGYTFTGWTLDGSGSFNINNNIFTFGDSNSTLTANWSINYYTVTCEDRVENSSGTLLGSSTNTYFYGSIASGADFGNNPNYNNYYLGYYYKNSSQSTVTNNITVYRYFSVNTYTLSISTSAQGVTTNISRSSSPMGGGSIGALTNGAILYYNDILSINYSLGGAYQLISANVNNVDISSVVLPYSVTVTNNIVVSITVRLGAIVYINNEAYQAFIGDDTNWNQYQAYIGNGTSFDQY